MMKKILLLLVFTMLSFSVVSLPVFAASDCPGGCCYTCSGSCKSPDQPDCGSEDCCCDSGGHRIGDICVGITSGCGYSHSQCICACPSEDTCSPNCSCAANTCKGNTCSDGCGGSCNGTMCCTNAYIDPTSSTVLYWPVDFTFTSDYGYTNVGFNSGGGATGCSLTNAQCEGNPKDSKKCWWRWRCTATGAAGSYTGTFTNSQGCTKTIAYTISCPTPPAVGQSGPPACTTNRTPPFTITSNSDVCIPHDGIINIRKDANNDLWPDDDWNGGSGWMDNVLPIKGSKYTYVPSPLADGLYIWRGRSRTNPDHILSIENPFISFRVCANWGRTCSGSSCVCNPVKPASPELLSPADGTQIEYGYDVTLSWRLPGSDWGNGCPANNNTFKLYLAEALGSCPDDLRASPTYIGLATEYFLSNPNYGAYCWQVEASNGSVSSFSVVRTFVVEDPQPWWQAKDGDVHAQGNIHVIVPKGNYLILEGDNGGQPGVASFKDDLNTQPGGLSTNNWQANTSYGARIGFEYLKNRLNIDTRDPKTGFGDISGSGIYYFDKAIDFGEVGEDFNVGTEKIIVFVDGDVSVKTNINITVDQGGFFALISSGDIVIDSEVTQAHGFFLADGEIRVPSNGGTDQVFEGQGSFIGRSGVSLERDLGPEDNVNPAEAFVSRFDLLLNAPAEFRFSPFVFQEVAP